MPESRSFTCILCPKGCRLTVSLEKGGVLVRGNACPRGAKYARQEAVAPMRTLTSTVRTAQALRRRLSVRSSADLPLARLREASLALGDLVARAPVACGDVLASDFLGLGVDIVATDDLLPSQTANGARKHTVGRGERA